MEIALSIIAGCCIGGVTVFACVCCYLVKKFNWVDFTKSHGII